jgi:hypothetical protein
MVGAGGPTMVPPYWSLSAYGISLPNSVCRVFQMATRVSRTKWSSLT